MGGSGKYISAISETEGKISATVQTMDTAPTANSTKAVTSGGVFNYAQPKNKQFTAFIQGGMFFSFDIKTNIIAENTSYIGFITLHIVGNGNVTKYVYGVLVISKWSTNHAVVTFNEMSKSNDVTLTITVNADNSINFNFACTSSLYGAVNLESINVKGNAITSIEKV